MLSNLPKIITDREIGLFFPSKNQWKFSHFLLFMASTAQRATSSKTAIVTAFQFQTSHVKKISFHPRSKQQKSCFFKQFRRDEVSDQIVFKINNQISIVYIQNHDRQKFTHKFVLTCPIWLTKTNIFSIYSLQKGRKFFVKNDNLNRIESFGNPKLILASTLGFSRQ